MPSIRNLSWAETLEQISVLIFLDFDGVLHGLSTPRSLVRLLRCKIARSGFVCRSGLSQEVITAFYLAKCKTPYRTARYWMYRSPGNLPHRSVRYDVRASGWRLKNR
mgnify:CR=1 FL=1